MGIRFGLWDPIKDGEKRLLIRFGFRLGEGGDGEGRISIGEVKSFLLEL